MQELILIILIIAWFADSIQQHKHLLHLQAQIDQIKKDLEFDNGWSEK